MALDASVIYTYSLKAISEAISKDNKYQVLEKHWQEQGKSLREDATDMLVGYAALVIQRSSRAPTEYFFLGLAGIVLDALIEEKNTGVPGKEILAEKFVSIMKLAKVADSTSDDQIEKSGKLGGKNIDGKHNGEENSGCTVSLFALPIISTLVILYYIF